MATTETALRRSEPGACSASSPLQPGTTMEVRYNLKLRKTTGIKRSKAKCTNHRRLIHEARSLIIRLKLNNKELVEELVKSKAKITQLEGAASRQLLLDALHLPRLNSLIQHQKGSIDALLKNNMRAIELMVSVMSPDATFAVPEENSLEEPRQSLYAPGCRYGDQDRSSMEMVLEEDEEANGESFKETSSFCDQPLLTSSPDESRYARVTVRKNQRYSGHQGRIPEERLANVDLPLGVPGFPNPDKQSSSLLKEITNQEKTSKSRTGSVVVRPHDKPCHEDNEGHPKLAADPNDSSSTIKNTQVQLCMVSEVPLSPTQKKHANTRKTRSSQTPARTQWTKELKQEETHTSLLEDEVLARSPIYKKKSKKPMPAPEGQGFEQIRPYLDIENQPGEGEAQTNTTQRKEAGVVQKLAAQLAAPLPEPKKKRGGNSRIKKGETTTADTTSKPAPQPSASTPDSDATTHKSSGMELRKRKSRGNKAEKDSGPR